MKTSSVNLTVEFAQAKQQYHRKTSRWRKLGRSIVAFLAGNSEPKIHLTASGIWHVYDPASGQTLHFSTEQEVRIWLDRRYSL